MPSRVAAYGFLGRYPGDVKRDAYRTPSVSGGPWGFRLFGLVLWPDVFSSEDRLLSVKVCSSDSTWKELLETPQLLSRYACRVPLENARACAPPRLQAAPGRFHTFVGETPIGWSALANCPEVALELQDTPPGRVAVRWSGALEGLLLLGAVS